MESPIKRAFRSRRSLVWIAGTLLLVVIFVSIGLLSDADSKTVFDGEPRYEFDRLLYLSPLSSSTFDYAESRMKGAKVTVSEDLFEIDHPEKDGYRLPDPVYVKETMTDDMVRAFENSTMEKVSISEYAERYRYTIYTCGNQKTNFRLYVLDGQVWLSSYADNTADKSEIVMDLWKLK